MAIEKSNVIDAIGIDKTTGETVLSLMDQYDWSDLNNHLEMLESKINMYLYFVESGEISSAHDPSVGRRVRIDAIFRYEPPEGAIAFLEKAKGVIDGTGVTFSWRTHQGEVKQGMIQENTSDSQCE